MRFYRKKLVELALRIQKNAKLTPDEIDYILAFEKKSEEFPFFVWLKHLALPLSLLLGFFSAVFPQDFELFVTTLPPWTNLPPHLLSGIDYMWDMLGDPVRKPNIVYHLPNIALYAITFFGLKKIFESLEKHSWLDRVRSAQRVLKDRLENGVGNFSLEDGHSLLFVGGGDYIGMQFILNHTPAEAITIAHKKPQYTKFWNNYDVSTLYEDLKDVMMRCDGQTTGEYIFFPVIDNEIFLPGPKAYDLSPHKLDILCQDIRMVEKEYGWKPKRIIIIGDTHHASFVQSENQRSVISKSQETITIETIAKRYPPVTILDPSAVVIEKIIDIARGRRIVFRATREGIAEYKKRFFARLHKQGYRHTKTKRGVLTIGYDLFEDQTEQQTLSRSVDDYYPVVLSKAVYDALIRNGYKEEEFLYVPNIVLSKLKTMARQQ